MAKGICLTAPLLKVLTKAVADQKEAQGSSVEFSTSLTQSFLEGMMMAIIGCRGGEDPGY